MQRIVDQIKVYVEEEKSDYAIMLNGTWRCGKTYFIKNDLSYKLYDLTHKPNIYISLFGIKTIEELYDLVTINILDIKNNENADKKSRMNGAKVDKRDYYRLVSLTREAVAVKKGIKEFISIFPVGKAVTNTARALSKAVISFKDYIFIFDDFERATIDKVELLAFIDSFVEQNNVKVIIVSNEFVLLPENKHKMNSNKSLTSSTGTNTKEKKNSHILKIVLPNFAKDDNISYLKYKEKVIGLTIEFKYILHKVFDSILNDYINDIECRRFIAARKERILQLFDTAQSNNLRTLEFIFKRFSEMYTSLIELDYKLKYSEQYLDVILNNMVASSIHSKEKGKLIEYDDDKFIRRKVWTRDGYGSRPPFSPIEEEIITWRAIDNYLTSYRIDIESLKYYIDDYINYLNSDAQGISMQLFNILFIENDEEACEALKRIQDKIYDNEYDINVYPHILDRLFTLYRLLPLKDSIDNLKQQILKNADLRSNDFSQFSWNTFEYDDSEAAAFKRELFDYLKGNKQSNVLEFVSTILDSDQLFAEHVNSVFANNEIAAGRNKGYFVGLSGTKFAERLLHLPLWSIRQLNTNLEHYYISTNDASVNYIQDNTFFLDASEKLEAYLNDTNLAIKDRTRYMLSSTLTIINQIVKIMGTGSNN